MPTAVDIHPQNTSLDAKDASALCFPDRMASRSHFSGGEFPISDVLLSEPLAREGPLDCGFQTDWLHLNHLTFPPAPPAPSPPPAFSEHRGGACLSDGSPCRLRVSKALGCTQ